MWVSFFWRGVGGEGMVDGGEAVAAVAVSICGWGLYVECLPTYRICM